MIINPIVAGNRGEVIANDLGRHGLPHSAAIVIPTQAIPVFARDRRAEYQNEAAIRRY